MKYDWKKTAFKFAKTGVYVLIAGIFALYADKPWLLAIAPMLHALMNYLKHKNNF